ncbi:hypothetical protein EDB81DRAFT_793197 [Dactylonectria macrodidyma]|uniref:Uncharacterized protein n=1 Tax=Dactylonectria macrodidyma TaxID=307937 RepID=A0A9P9J5B8_9HYPO|nr:hypothetical protein EDB81DRAFT_793197 [Dactylonectria macrodidyma]
MATAKVTNITANTNGNANGNGNANTRYSQCPLPNLGGHTPDREGIDSWQQRTRRPMLRRDDGLTRPYQKEDRPKRSYTSPSRPKEKRVPQSRTPETEKDPPEKEQPEVVPKSVLSHLRRRRLAPHQAAGRWRLLRPRSPFPQLFHPPSRSLFLASLPVVCSRYSTLVLHTAVQSVVQLQSKNLLIHLSPNLALGRRQLLPHSAPLGLASLGNQKAKKKASTGIQRGHTLFFFVSLLPD